MIGKLIGRDKRKEYTGWPKAILVFKAKPIKVITKDGQYITFSNVHKGQVLPIYARVLSGPALEVFE